MDNTMNEMKEVTFMDEILQQPGVLRRFAEEAFAEESLEKALQEVNNSGMITHIILTGMGSSLYACYITMRFLRNRGFRVSVMEALELEMLDEAFFGEDSLVVAVSQSGESPEVLDVVKKLPSNVKVVAVTNYPKSHLHQMTELNAGIYAGTEYRTSTKSYTNSLAAMLLLGYRIAGCSKEEIEKLRQEMLVCADKMEEMIAQKKTGEEIAAFISDIKFFVCVGSGYSYTTASHSEVIAEEAGKFYASRFTPAQFIHGPIELIDKGFAVLVYDFDRDFSAKCDAVRENVLYYGGKVLLITNRKDVPQRDNQMVCVIDHEDPETAVLLEVIPMELGIDALCNERGVAAGCLSRVVKRMAI